MLSVLSPKIELLSRHFGRAYSNISSLKWARPFSSLLAHFLHPIGTINFTIEKRPVLKPMEVVPHTVFFGFEVIYILYLLGLTSKATISSTSKPKLSKPIRLARIIGHEAHLGDT